MLFKHFSSSQESCKIWKYDDDDDDDSGGSDNDIPSLQIRKATCCLCRAKIYFDSKPTFFSLLFFFLCVLILIAWYKRAYGIFDALMVNNMESISISFSGITLKPQDEA